MSSTVQNKADLKTWFERVKNAKSRKEVLAILDDFRKEDWTNEERSQMGHLYTRMLEVLGEDADDDTKTSAAAKDTTAASKSGSAGSSPAPGSKSDAVLEDPFISADENQPADDGPVWYEKM